MIPKLFNLARNRARPFISFYKKQRPTPYHSRLNGGGHGGFIRVKFNSIAKRRALTDNGKLPLNVQTFRKRLYLLSQKRI
jgi:hypothetical protein